MARADQIKALIDTHLAGDHERFRAIALQIAAHESSIGHVDTAEYIKRQWDQKNMLLSTRKVQPLLNGLLEARIACYGLDDLVVDDGVKELLKLVLQEQRSSSLLLAHDLVPRRKLLLTGPPGTGKTMTAMVLSRELTLPLYVVCWNGLFKSFLGETAANLHKIFNFMQDHRGIYFFDEFDALGSDRGKENDVGEVRRVLNSFLILLEQEASESIIIAATNLVEILDRALWRRFDTIIKYGLPDEHQIQRLVQKACDPSPWDEEGWQRIREAAQGLSHAEILQAVNETRKAMLLGGWTQLRVDRLEGALRKHRDR